MPFLVANVAEIMRSGQKDDELTNGLVRSLLNKAVESVANLHSLCVGNLHLQDSSRLPADWMTWSSEIELLTSMLYYIVTTVSGQQTIGEEYVNIVQVDGSYRHHPRVVLRAAMAALHCFGPYIITKCAEKLRRRVNSSSWIVESKKPLVGELLNCTTNVLHWCYRVQRSLFFLQLSSANISKHFCSVNYVSIRRNPLNQYKWFTLLGYFGIVQSIVSLFHGVKAMHKMLHNSKSQTMSTKMSVACTQSRCPLCYDPYRDITCTPCGHLFCWNCIYPWASATPRCPVCRLDCEPRKLVLLINFDL